jgi:peptidoglycan/LPS O-acetylase OafA/YrhL
MPRPENYQRHIDGLRAVAVLCVVFYHYGQSVFSGGFVGVDVFFVISGYLISNLILGELSDTGDFNFKRFYIRRIRRLFPALVVTLTLSLIFSVALFSPEQLQNYGRSLAAAVFSVSNIQFWLESGYFDNDSHLKPLLHTWSLSVEEQFYLFWPAILWFFARGSNQLRQFLVLATLGGASFGLNYFWVHGQFDSEFNSTIFYLTPFRIFELVLGGMAIFVRRLVPSQQWLQELMMATGLALIAYAVVSYSDLTVFPYLAALTPCIGALLVIVSPRSRLMGSLLTNQLAVGIGLISYSLYLIHWPVLVFYEYYTFVPLVQSEYAALFLLSCVLSILMYFYVEKPFRKNTPARKHSRPQTVFVYSSIGVMIVIGMIGFQIGQSDGKNWRDNRELSAKQVSQGSEDRLKLLRVACNLLRLEKPRYCKLKRPHRILVIGNSHEIDGYNIFSRVYARNQNVNLILFGSINNCEITMTQGFPYSAVEDRNCRVRTAKLVDKNFLDTLDGVIYSSNRPFGENKEGIIYGSNQPLEENKKVEWELLEYIQSNTSNIPTIVLGGYLNTVRKCSELYYRFGTFSACNQSEHLSYSPFNERKASEIEQSHTLKYLYIDKARILCRDKTPESCDITGNGEPAFYDNHHLSFGFSAHLGTRIAKEYREELRAWGFPSVISRKKEKVDKSLMDSTNK